MRRLIAAALAGLLGACASTGAPPGGPEDDAPPLLVRITPDSGATRVPSRALVFRFDEVVSDRPAGVTDLAGLVLISPRTGAPRVDWDRESFSVRPRGGWRPNTTYTVTLLPGVVDLRGNTIKTTRTVVFSTGPELARAAIPGRIFNWSTAEPAANALVEAVSLPAGRDSVVYVGAADSSGAFAVGPLPPGDYLVRGFIDQNRNRGLDRVELWDSTTVRVADAGPAPLELLAALRDTIGARITTITAPDSVTLVLTVDRPLQPGQPLAPAQFSVRRDDSTTVAVTAVAFRGDDTPPGAGGAPGAVRDTGRTRADSAPAGAIPAGRDTLARRDARARRDTLARRDTSGVARDSAVVRQDSAVAPRPRPSRPPPPTRIALTLGEPLRPGTSYRVRAEGLRTITGAVRATERVFTMPRPTPATQTTPPTPVTPGSTPATRPDSTPAPTSRPDPR